jgi:hypothetical protein
VGDARNDAEETVRAVAAVATRNDRESMSLVSHDDRTGVENKRDQREASYRADACTCHDRDALNSLRLVASVAAVTNGKRLLQYSHSGNK